ncbi:hypothetical protein [Thiobacillus sedimenti]|uniref:Uncharacterized protein n=1 Tax=Thiobacillus sedimenti TaxID=3110231 RepID=A0ABZ1CJK6_9PROT|nr:hypothetical protein [Thiobacillus sp. SCUT-2]WRS39568.1 hypothetical protein VA613_01490 [Thiobacillus sp. SCUT-2]
MNTNFTPHGLAVAALLACGTAHAGLSGFDGYAAATDAELDAMRGGFEFNLNGMQVTLAFSLEQLTYVNGQLVSSMKLTPLQFGPVASPVAGGVASVPPPAPASPVTNAPSPPSGGSPPPQLASGGSPPTTVTTQILNNQGVLTLVQNGTGNNFTLPESLSALNTVIQNTVDNQVIRNLTVLNATLSMQQAAAAMRLGAALNQLSAAGLR